ncbi:hypothetical protein QN372_00300 [Undibacterium sp. RTI2.1]|uniref:hypothetical protein n=1 Tax=unclassified Undibacterium TaxID=2630295 RepID=UPI002AB48EDC|nr:MULTISPECIES: hypothetical protein [unclassified Undibacterium]MDY7537579.1 hypothetical protein [Undibacterium sp. 5I1]MEB0029179.1 hypothetical protein [Undibacterium sp. RTI2.1]MEB0115487.1 hypothetical protein [Undibacterium sp. RTI2.2]MEB0231964.1 hypothetical protein [Undibacterium sp. 10I3]MEB0256315.1 hypothetical protein [Undibacterium sp. 5I1]
MNKITINGLNISGARSISINNGRVVVNGKDVTPDSKEIRIEVHGDIETINADACESISVTGTAGTVKTLSGDVRCGNVSGSVKTMSGDVHCGAISGDVETMSGNIRREK